jgi:hypothetical protein
VRSTTGAGAGVDVVPSAAPTAGTPAPTAEAVPGGRLMSGAAGDPAAPVTEAAVAEAPPVPAIQQIRTGSSALETAADATPASGLLLAAGTVVGAGAVLLILRRFRAGARRFR